MAADFVVDASGRSSQLPQWLDAIGVTAPQAQCISAGLGYGSRTYAMPANWFQQKVCVLVSTLHWTLQAPMPRAIVSALTPQGPPK